MKRAAARGLVAGAFSFLATPAFAQASPPSSMGSLVQGTVGLVIVVALIYGAAWLLRRVQPRTMKGGLVQVLGGASVGPREKVVVVRFGARTLLLGVAPGHVGLLHETDAADATDAPVTVPPRFVDRLRAAKGDA